MSIEHKNIPDSQLHEPKGAASASIGQVYVADGAGSGTWEKLSEASLERTNATNNLFGWIDISDALYTSASPLAIAANTRTQITNNGLAVQTNTSRLPLVWDTASGILNIDDLNGAYVMRITAKIKAVAAAGTPYTAKLELESNNGPLVFVNHTHYLKGGSYENSVSFTAMFYMGSVINGTDVKIYITPDTAITMYDIGFMLQRLYTEKNA